MQRACGLHVCNTPPPGVLHPTHTPLSFLHPPPPIATPHNMAYELIRRFTGGNDPPAEVPRLLSAIFDAQDYVPSLEKLQEQDLGIWLERLDQVC